MIEVEGIRLAYRVWGSPDAEPLVLLHALAEGAADWDVVAPAFARQRRVYAPDLRGHGLSDWDHPERVSRLILEDAAAPALG